MSTTAHTRFSSEEEMYSLWPTVALPASRLRTRDGAPLLVVSPGRRNNLSGPDFLDAVLVIAGEVRIGPVEMHRREREWYEHRHERDSAYDGVILHVVGEESPGRGPDIPTLILEPDAEADRRGNRTIDATINDPSNRSDLFRLLAELSWERFLDRSSRFHLEKGESLDELSLLVPLFDALGYSANRTPLRRTAERLLVAGPGATARDILVQTIRCSDLPNPIAERILRRFGIEGLPPDSGRAGTVDGPSAEQTWNFRLRPANRPETRLVAGAVLADRLFRRGGLERIRSAVEQGVRGDRVVRDELLVRSGGFSFLGTDRAGAILVNVLLPALLAEGMASGCFNLIAGACRCYRQFPSLSSNTILRRFSERFLDGRSLSGSFLQQGVIAYMSRNSAR